jgi:hypothetical protein
LRYFYFLLIIFSFAALDCLGQVRLSGRVFDFSKENPLEAVSVMATNGKGTFTDADGRYTIMVSENDSVWFSYLGKPTPKFAVATIFNIQDFEVALHVNTTVLKQVTVRPRNYRMDSIQNRLDYAKVFNFKRPSLESMTSLTPGGVGLDLDELIRVFQFNKNRRMEAFQERLLREETEKNIDHRFNRALIIKLTQLKGKELDTFIDRYRPSADFTETASEYEFQLYIKRAGLHYKIYGNEPVQIIRNLEKRLP